MDEDIRKITRREALKKIGAITAGVGLGISGVEALELMKGNAVDRKMNVLLVNGSPHKEGCTYTALLEVGKGLEEQGITCETFWIGKQAISGCVACGACNSSGRCYMNDIVNEFLDKATNFDAFVFGSPVHFSAIAGSMTSFMNRAFFSARSTDIFKGKPVAAVTSCRRSGAVSTLDQFNRYFIHGGMPVVPSQYWPMVFGNTPEQVLQDGEGLQIMRTLGRNMAWMLKNIEAGVQADIRYPERGKNTDEFHQIGLYYVTKGKNYIGFTVLYRNHFVVFGFYRKCSCMVRMDGKDSVPASIVGLECRGCICAINHYIHLRTCLLFHNMSAWRVAGLRFMD